VAARLEKFIQDDVQARAARVDSDPFRQVSDVVVRVPLVCSSALPAESRRMQPTSSATPLHFQRPAQPCATVTRARVYATSAKWSHGQNSRTSRALEELK
jgi:hypothetical protein